MLKGKNKSHPQKENLYTKNTIHNFSINYLQIVVKNHLVFLLSQLLYFGQPTNKLY